MNFATDLLEQEHKLIERVLTILQQATDLLEKNPNASLDNFEQAVDFIRIFADKIHHGKEEDILFKHMAQNGIPTEGGPIAVMLQEHQLARTCTAELAKAIEMVQTGDKTFVNKIIENALYYKDLLSQHIYKENNILYPMGNQVFTQTDQEFLVAEFERVNTAFGTGIHEHYHQIVDSLEKKLGIKE